MVSYREASGSQLDFFKMLDEKIEKVRRIKRQHFSSVALR